MATYIYGDYELWTQINVNFRAWFAYSVSSTDTTYSITVYAGPQLSGNTGTVQCSLSCKLTATGQTTRSTTKTFSTGSDDSSKRMTFLSSKKWTWNKTSSTQSVTIKATVDRSNMTASVASKTFTIPALASYNVSYNSNGGSGSISTQKKYYGKSLTLSNGSGLTKSGNTLKNWNTASNGSGTSYELGQTYTSNKALTLYAQWSTNYSITNLQAIRTNDDGEVSARGEYFKISFEYNTLSTTGLSYSVYIDGSSVKTGTLYYTTGTISFYTSSTYSLDETHTITVNISSVSKSITVPIAVRPLDIVGTDNDISMGIMSPANPDVPLMLTTNCSIDSGGKLTVENHSSPIGTIITASPSESEASATDYVSLTSEYLSLPAGTWVITYSCYCDVNSAGKRLGARLYNRTSGTNYTSSRAIAHTQNTAAICITGSIPLTVSTTTSIALQAYQNSGSAKTITGYMRAVRIA